MKTEKKDEKPVVKKEQPSKKSEPPVIEKPKEEKHRHRYSGSGGY